MKRCFFICLSVQCFDVRKGRFVLKENPLTCLIGQTSSASPEDTALQALEVTLWVRSLFDMLLPWLQSAVLSCPLVPPFIQLSPIASVILYPPEKAKAFNIGRSIPAVKGFLISFGIEISLQRWPFVTRWPNVGENFLAYTIPSRESYQHSIHISHKTRCAATHLKASRLSIPFRTVQLPADNPRRSDARRRGCGR